MAPPSLHQTFDNSLVDVQRSFSSTETNTSNYSAMEIIQPKADPGVHNADELSVSAADKTLPNDVLYDQWAGTYDTDGNVLQAVDDQQMRDMIPEFIRLVTNNQSQQASDHDSVTTKARPVRLLDFGCGTGRNTCKFLQAHWNRAVVLEAWDGSEGMLNVARSKCETVQAETRRTAESNDGNHTSDLSFHHIDFGNTANLPQEALESFDGIISTLVLEHLAAKTYFSAIKALLKPGGYALISNMHSGMGASTRAGYKTSEGERVKGSSYVHTVERSIEVANEEGLRVLSIPLAHSESVNGVQEVTIDEQMIEQGLVGARGRKWLGIKIWYGMILQKL